MDSVLSSPWVVLSSPFNVLEVLKIGCVLRVSYNIRGSTHLQQQWLHVEARDNARDDIIFFSPPKQLLNVSCLQDTRSDLTQLVILVGISAHYLHFLPRLFFSEAGYLTVGKW